MQNQTLKYNKIIVEYIFKKSMQKNLSKPDEQQSNITVAIRIRPLNAKQMNSGDMDIIRVQDNLILVLDPLDIQIEEKKVTDVLHRSKQQRYAFDKIYRNHQSQTIYIETVQPLIKTVLNGFNATVFAYGPTGTGKTYTMLGNQQTYGLNVLAINDLFKSIESDNDNNYEICITYVEIYNQMIRDLLVPASGYLELRDDPEKGVVIAGVTQFKAESTDQVMNLLLIGNKRRTTQATNANLTSSRSHAVFQIMLNKVSRTRNTTVQNIIGKLSLIDLAGSQRGTVTENRGLRLMEGAKINRSLLALANCINALGDKNKKGFFVPYRDSKLTRLLKDSLGGSCKTVMIVNISPSSSQFEETINTLKYANRAKNIKTKALTNKKLVALHISEYKNIINDLRRQIQQLKQRLSDKGYDESVDNRDKLPKIDNKMSKPPLPVNNSIMNQATSCACGHLDQKEQMKNIKEQIFQNFNERIQLRRAMMQIEQQNAMNILQIKKKQGQVAMLKKNQNWQETDGQSIRQLTKLITTLKLSTNKNNLKKQITNLQIMQSMTNTKKIRDQILRKIKSKQNRQVLQIIIKNHVLELQNIELQINLQIQQRMISDMKQIITSQKIIIAENNIEGLGGVEDQILGLGDEDVLELEEDFDQENQSPGSEDQDGEPDYKNFEFKRNKNPQRNKSAKKDIEVEKGRKKLQELNLKRNMREKTTQKAKPSIDLASLGLGLKGMKMNPKKKR